MISINEGFNDLEKKLIGRVPDCIIPALRRLPNNSEYLNALRFILSNLDKNISFNPVLYNKKYNFLEIHLLSKGIPNEVINGLRSAYIDQDSYNKALGIVYEDALKYCLRNEKI